MNNYSFSIRRTLKYSCMNTPIGIKMRTKYPAKNRVSMKVYPEEWKYVKDSRRLGETMADTVKRILEKVRA